MNYLGDKCIELRRKNLFETLNLSGIHHGAQLSGKAGRGLNFSSSNAHVSETLSTAGRLQDYM